MRECDDYQRSVRGCQGALPLASMALSSLALSTTFRQLHVSSNVFHHLFSARKRFALWKASNHSDKLEQLSGVIVFLPPILWRVPNFFWRPCKRFGWNIFLLSKVIGDLQILIYFYRTVYFVMWELHFRELKMCVWSFPPCTWIIVSPKQNRIFLFVRCDSLSYWFSQSWSLICN